MNRLYILGVSILIASIAVGCGYLNETVKETSEGYQIQKGASLNVILQTPLSSNTNQRGDQFTTKLKQSLLYKEKTILPKDTQIRGLVKRVNKYEGLGDRASLLLIFDQLVLPDGKRIPIVASLDTDEGSKVIKIKGKDIQDAKVVGGGAIVGSLVGKQSLGKDGAKKGLLIGAGVGAGAVMLSNMKEVRLPQGAELIIKLDSSLLVPK